ncbi:phosphoglycerate mutase-like protein [Fragilariopsis cylindrus CCMP1102]|uniref:Phosphoglycerate mutase-like protein n=1 Tax=Fragilariopsis cylindrus CCMP1102 TaxID=635003 RepID=A0A1E7FJK3_9STRA|nr:phosphoglycerate mutase-like protein [Fragilariopsis cylindrus CCMP1102]|eukprot:OEU18346.1 phosphoglycerate mutase-like protein [Fragilariopsis cylindrus CCMP1102]
MIIIRQQQQHKLASSSSSSLSSSFSLRLSSSDSSIPSVNNSSSSTSSSSSFRNHLLLPINSDLATNKDTNNGGQLQLLRNHFYALRHGQSLANVAGLIASNPNIACTNYGLSDVGKKQAKEAETSDDDSSSQSQSPTGIVIVSSDLLRAKETAQIVADTIHSITIDIRLRERGFGDWDGGNDIHYNDVWKEDAIDPYHTKNNVESVWSVIDRATRCVIDWDKNDQKSGKNLGPGGYYWIICVAHGDVLQILQTPFNKNIDPSQHRSIQHLETATLRSLL